MFLKNKNIIFKIRRSKVTDYAALKICMHIKRYVALCLFNGSFRISLSARLPKIGFVALRSAIL